MIVKAGFVIGDASIWMREDFVLFGSIGVAVW